MYVTENPKSRNIKQVSTVWNAKLVKLPKKNVPKNSIRTTIAQTFQIITYLHLNADLISVNFGRTAIIFIGDNKNAFVKKLSCQGASRATDQWGVQLFTLSSTLEQKKDKMWGNDFIYMHLCKQWFHWFDTGLYIRALRQIQTWK